jgi:hypothetical protein
MSKSLKVHLFSASDAFEGDCNEDYLHILGTFIRNIVHLIN